MNTQPAPNTPHNSRGTATESPTVTIDPISEVTQIIRTLVHYYTENITQHNHIIETYNQNVTTLLTLLNTILELHASRNRPIDNRDFSYYYRNLFQPRRGGGGSARNRTTSLDLSNLVYLLNIPIQTTVGGGAAASAAERPIPLTLTEIAHATRIIYYDESSMGERRCPISLDDFIPNEQICQIRGCRHIFKPQHLLRWLEYHVECPVCRYDLRQYRASGSQSASALTPTPTPTPVSDTVETEAVDLPTIDISMNLESELDQDQSQPIRRNVSVSEFLPILENILSSDASYTDSNNGTTTRNRSRGMGMGLSSNSASTSTASLSNLLSNRFSQILSDIILEQIPAIDSSNNLLYTIEIPLTR